MFLLLPIKTDKPLRTVPWANWLLIVTNVGVYLLEHGSGAQRFADWALNSQRPELHQFVSYAFRHAGPMHIAMNMLFLYIFGNNVCDKLGNVAYLAFYLAGAVFSGFGYAAIYDTGIVVGASGAVAAVTGAYLALMPRSHITLFYWVFIMIGVYEIPSLWFIIAFFVQDVFYSFSRETDVAHVAHVGGSVFGFLMCMVLLKLQLLARDHFDMLAMLDRWRRRVEYQSVVRAGYDPFAYAPRQGGAERGGSAGQMEQVQELRAQIAEEIAHGNLPAAAESYLRLRKLDPGQTLSRGTQVDIANHFYSVQDYENAVAAYELYLKSYPNTDLAGQVSLMLGLAYGRHMGRPDRAKEVLKDAVRLLQFSREQEIAQSELARLEAGE